MTTSTTRFIWVKTAPARLLWSVLVPTGASFVIVRYLVPSVMEGRSGGLLARVGLIADQHPLAVAVGFFLAVSAAPEQAVERVTMIAKGACIDVAPALQALVRRFERLEQGGIDLGKSTFATEFGRSFEYYSGLVFQIEVGGEGDASQIAGGGRYDGLLAHIGAPREVPAIGAAMHAERLLAAVERGA